MSNWLRLAIGAVLGAILVLAVACFAGGLAALLQGN